MNLTLNLYDTYANAQALMGGLQITRVSLVLDSGWAGDQRVNLTSATVNTDTFTPQAASSPTPVCPTAQATIGVVRRHRQTLHN